MGEIHTDTQWQDHDNQVRRGQVPALGLPQELIDDGMARVIEGFVLIIGLRRG